MKLPENIDYTLYYSESGFNTKFWGPTGWKFFFTSIMNYPVKIDSKNKEHQEIKTHYRYMLTSLGYTMPCIFCRNSFKEFLKELPIEAFLVGRVELMYWLYLIKDLVNQKLITQEKKCYDTEKKRLKTLYYNGIITKEEYYQKTRQFKEENSYTKPTPPFEEVLEFYESQRAVCSTRAKKCSLPKRVK